jgi:hypothetical protein
MVINLIQSSFSKALGSGSMIILEFDKPDFFFGPKGAAQLPEVS